MKDRVEQQADEILREAAHSEHKSMRDLGIIDERRERTIREREQPFADYFARKTKHRETS